jgi:hypothetical protein
MDGDTSNMASINLEASCPTASTATWIIRGAAFSADAQAAVGAELQRETV